MLCSAEILKRQPYESGGHLPDNPDHPEIPDIPDSKVNRPYSPLPTISPSSYSHPDSKVNENERFHMKKAPL